MRGPETARTHTHANTYTCSRQRPVSVFGDHDSKVRLKGFGVMNEKLSKAEDGTNLSRIFYHGDDALCSASNTYACQACDVVLQGLKSNGQCRCSRTVLSVYTHQDTHHKDEAPVLKPGDYADRPGCRATRNQREQNSKPASRAIALHPNHLNRVALRAA